ncbi:hypothetical protein V5738_09930 [Salinisphaera sp. SPP-AMP-43]|uniref:amino acid kinase family protein n=1 Tax=Salinisphaera sp. SPP-AMP-43 TaxID=3121288 RepID=UPI003C6DDA4F
MRVVVVLGEKTSAQQRFPSAAAGQRAYAEAMANALAPLIHAGHEVVLVYGNTPGEVQACRHDSDLLGAALGSLLEQELGRWLPPGRLAAVLLTQIEVDPTGAAMATTAGPKGCRRLESRPTPLRVLAWEVVNVLLDQGVVPICGLRCEAPLVRGDDGMLTEIESALIDPDAVGALLAQQLRADALLLLSDFEAVAEGIGVSGARRLRVLTTELLDQVTFSSSSLSLKITAAERFVRQNRGLAVIGRPEDVNGLLNGEAGTRIEPGTESEAVYYEADPGSDLMTTGHRSRAVPRVLHW